MMRAICLTSIEHWWRIWYIGPEVWNVCNHCGERIRIQ